MTTRKKKLKHLYCEESQEYVNLEVVHAIQDMTSKFIRQIRQKYPGYSFRDIRDIVFDEIEWEILIPLLPHLTKKKKK